MPVVKPDISIIIPVWNEASKIQSDVENALRFFDSKKLKGEVIVSDDGSEDNTVMIIEEFMDKNDCPVRIARNPHLGKGHAVKSAMLWAEGQIILFIDSGCCISYEDVWKGVNMVREGMTDIAHASRYMAGSRIVKPKGAIRRLASRLFRKFVHIYMKIPEDFTDTQCGLKIYRGDVARKIYNPCFTLGFMFDIETIIRAVSENFRIMEFAVTWRSDPDSRLSILWSLPRILMELKTIRRRLVDPEKQ